MFSKSSGDKESFLKQANEAREKRNMEKKRLNSAIIIQSLYRGHRTRKALKNNLE